jgi:phage-related protein
MRNVVFALDAAAEAARRRMHPALSLSLAGATVRDESGNGIRFTGVGTPSLLHDGAQWVFRFYLAAGDYLTSAVLVPLATRTKFTLGVAIRANSDGYIAVGGTGATYFTLTAYSGAGPRVVDASVTGDVGSSAFRSSGISIHDRIHTIRSRFDKTLPGGQETAVTIDGSSAGSAIAASNNTNGFSDDIMIIGYAIDADIARIVLCHDADSDWGSADDQLMDSWLEGRTGLIGPVEVGGTDIVRDLGYMLTRTENWGAGLRTTYPSAALPGGIGSVRSDAGSVQPRTIPIGIKVKAATLSERDARLAHLRSLFRGDVVLRFGDAPWKKITGKCVAESSAGIAPTSGFAIADVVATFEIECADPVKYDVDETVLAFSTNTAVPVGDIRHGGVIRITGAATNPTVTYKNSAGTTIATLGLTDIIASGDWVEIDLDRRTIRRSVSGVVTYNAALRTSGDYFWIDPDDASGTSNPTLSVSSGTGQITYRRRWGS